MDIKSIEKNHNLTYTINIGEETRRDYKCFETVARKIRYPQIYEDYDSELAWQHAKPLHIDKDSELTISVIEDDFTIYDLEEIDYEAYEFLQTKFKLLKHNRLTGVKHIKKAAAAKTPIEDYRVGRKNDRRIKLTDDKRESIRQEYALGDISQSELARKYRVSRRLITFVLDPIKYEISKQQFKERRKDGRYAPTADERTELMREHREYKRKLIQEDTGGVENE